MKMSFCVKRLISLLASLVITAGIFSAPGLSAPIYAEETSERNSKTVKVTVTATPADGGEDVPVSGALVSVYRGDGRKGETINFVDSFETGEDGIAECVIPIPEEYRDDENKVNEYLSTLTFSATKKVANSKGMDYMDSEVRNYRDRLFRSTGMVQTIESRWNCTRKRWMKMETGWGTSSPLEMRKTWIWPS